MPLLETGTTAPDFTLVSHQGQPTQLSKLRGSPVVLIFYPLDWSPVCGDQLGLYNEIHEEFTRFGAKLVAISVDSFFCHKAFVDDRHFEFTLLSDFEPKGAVAKLYRAYRPPEGVAERALYVLDRDGVIRWSYLSPIDQNPGADGILAALEEIEGGVRA